MNLAPDVVKAILWTGIPLIIVTFSPFWSLRRMRVFFRVFVLFFILQFLLIYAVVGMAGMSSGFGVHRRSPWDGTSALLTLTVFSACVFFLGWFIRWSIKRFKNGDE